MDLNQKIQDILATQKDIAGKFEKLIEEFDLKNILADNEALKKELENYRKNIEEIKEISNNLKKENDGLRIALKEQILDEKLNILKISREKIDTYFRTVQESYHNSLFEFENNSRNKLLNLSEIIRKELADDDAIFNKEIENLTKSINQRIKEKEEALRREHGRISENIDKDQKEIMSEEISEEVLRKRIKQNNIEFKIGLSWVNKIGILLILIGISSGIQYTYTQYFVNEMKAVFIFLIGILLLGVGEYFVRRNKEVFALGLCGGGIGVLFMAAYHSYFNLNVISLETALFIAVVITAVSFILSIRYSSRTIASFSLIGGFLPFFTYAYEYSTRLTEQFIMISMGYLLMLNLLTLCISVYKKWDIVKYLSFLLNVPTLCFLVFNTENYSLSIAYTILTFAMYLVISLAYPYKNKIALNPWDTALLGINTAASCGIIYILFDMAKLTEYRGLLAILFCVVYLGLGQFANKYLVKDKNAIIVFYLTSFAFAVLAVPFQLGMKWFAMGWLIEAVLMIIFGYKNKIKHLEIGGWIVLGLCFIGVLTVDFYRYVIVADREDVPHFHLRYLFVILGMLITLYTYLIDFSKDQMLKYTRRGKLLTFYKYFVVVNFWIFSMYMANSLVTRILMPYNVIESYYYGFAIKMLYAIVSMFVAYCMLIAPLIKDKVVSIFANILFAFSVLTLIIVNFSEPMYISDYSNFKYFALGILFLFNILAFITVKYLLTEGIKGAKISLELLPISCSIYLLANITGILVYQFNLGEINMLYSIIYIVSALICVIFGFKRKYVATRRFGLFLVVFALAKLFIFDLSNLELGGKIVSYICFGLTLLGISFMYQKFNNASDDLQLALFKGEKDSSGKNEPNP